MCPEVTSFLTCVLEDGVSKRADGQEVHGHYSARKQTVRTNTLVSQLESTNSQIIISASHQHPEFHSCPLCYLAVAARVLLFDSPSAFHLQLHWTNTTCLNRACVSNPDALLTPEILLMTEASFEPRAPWILSRQTARHAVESRKVVSCELGTARPVKLTSLYSPES